MMLLLILFGLAWAALYAAAVSRKRIRMATDQPLKALYETVGACGNPPRDESYNFAVYAIVITVLAWIVIPLAIWLALKAGDDKDTSTTVTTTIGWLTGLLRL